jgi:predicted nucleotidyltransferase
MKIIGITTEYNPFHSGHLSQIKMLRRRYPDCIIILAMSGNFVQRGEVAVLDKYQRASLAILYGADIVFELPVVFATASSSLFAWGAATLFHRLGCINILAFGAENNDIECLNLLAGIIAQEPLELGAKLRKEMKNGVPYPIARGIAMDQIVGAISSHGEIVTPSVIVGRPNNILAIDYLSSLKKLNSSMEPLPLPRLQFDSEKTNSEIVSASKIRAGIFNSGCASISQYVPSDVYKTLRLEAEEKGGVMQNDRFSQIILYLLRTLPPEKLSAYSDDSEGLVHRIIKQAQKSTTWTELVENSQCGRYPKARIQRLLIRTLLQIDNNFLENAREHGTQYGRLLAVKKSRTKLLKKISSNQRDTFPIIIKASHTYINKANLNEFGIQCLKADIRASNVFSLGYNNKHAFGCMDFERFRPIILD